MASFLDPTYNRAKDSASSGSEVTDLNPERKYAVDVRRLDEGARDTAEVADTSNEAGQDRASKFFKAAKAAGKYQMKAAIDEPLIRGQPTQNSAYLDGVFTPSLGDTQGPVGATKYAGKPQPFAGKPYAWLDSFS